MKAYPGSLWLIAPLALLAVWAPAADEIPAHRAKQIYEAAPARASVTPKKPRRVLIWNTPAHLMEKDPHKGYCIPYGAAAFEALGRKTGAFEPVVSGDLSLLLPESIGRFDAIVMNNSSGAWITPTEANLATEAFQRHGLDQAAVEQVLRKAFLDFVTHGGGVVSIHFAIAANAHWPAFQELLGAKYTGHPWNEEIGVTLEEPGHPLSAAFEGKDFRLADEIYEYGAPYDRTQLRVLMSLDPARSNMGVKWINRKDNDFALTWVKSHGKGRVFNTTFGHRTELFWHPPLLRFYLDAIQFATGDLDAPTAPRLDRPARQTAGADSTEPAARQQLVGVWKGFAVEGRGEKPDQGPVKLELRITEKSMKGLEFKGTNVVDHGEGEFALDLGQIPRRLDAWKTNERGRKLNYVGIYVLEGDTLKWCVSPRPSRPTEFRTGDGGFLLILKRQKP